MRIARALVVLVLLACAAPVAAQTPSTTAANQPEENVVVTAPQVSQQTEVLRFVRGHARLSRIDQLARWRDPICIRVMNLPANYAAFIANRIKTIAREAGAPTAADGAECAPNVSIIFTAQPQEILDQVRSDSPVLLGFHFIGQRDQLATMTRPIQGWYVTGTATDADTYLDDSRYDPPSGTTGSRLSHGLQSVFMHVLIIVDQSKVEGAAVGPISDYLAVLTLTEIRDEAWACGGLVTIMEHFSNCTTAPETVTTADRAFLRGLYTMDLRAVVSLQRAHIRQRVSGALRDEH